LGDCDRHGRKPVIIISSWFLTIIMIITAYLPSDYTSNYVIYLTILFVITRALIGFFVGGLWPTAAVLAMENLHWNKFEKNNNGEKNTVPYNEEWKGWEKRWEKWNNDFEKEVKRLTFQSSLLQVGYFIGYLVSALLLIVCGDIIKQLTLTSPILHMYSDFALWRSMSFFAGFFQFVLTLFCIKYLHESSKWKEWNKGWKEWMKKKQKDAKLYGPGITTLLENKKYRETLFSFWLILTGLMYMYYSTIITAPELFLRDKVGEATKFLQSMGGFFVILLIMMAVAHIWVGLLLYFVWKRPDRFRLKRAPSLKRILCLKSRIHYLFLKLIGYDHKYNKKHEESSKEKLVDDLDVRLTILLGFVLIPIGFLGSIFFYMAQPDKSGVNAVLYTGIVILVANAGWAPIPAMLSSRFPIHLRSTGANLAYNGGLVIGFASPFIIIESYLYLKNEYLIFVAMILGAASMIVGGRRLMRIINQNEKL
jgi:MFS family permease